MNSHLWTSTQVYMPKPDWLGLNINKIRICLFLLFRILWNFWHRLTRRKSYRHRLSFSKLTSGNVICITWLALTFTDQWQCRLGGYGFGKPGDVKLPRYPDNAAPHVTWSGNEQYVVKQDKTRPTSTRSQKTWISLEHNGRINASTTYPSYIETVVSQSSGEVFLCRYPYSRRQRKQTSAVFPFL